MKFKWPIKNPIRTRFGPSRLSAGPGDGDGARSEPSKNVFGLFFNTTPSKNRAFTIFALILFLVAGCSREPEPPPPATKTPAPPPIEITYCDINPSNMCLEGFGQEGEERLLILFKTAKPRYRDIHIRADGPEGESLFECQQSGNIPENVYCMGEPVDEEELVKLNIYSNNKNRLIAIGVFNIRFTDLAEPDVEFGATNATPAASPDPSYPNPAGPTPSYPNPTPSS